MILEIFFIVFFAVTFAALFHRQAWGIFNTILSFTNTGGAPLKEYLEGGDELFTACAANDLKKVITVLEANAVSAISLIQAGQVKHQMRTPLHIACQSGFLGIVQELLKAKTLNLDVVTLYGETPLHLACKHGHADVVKEMMLCHADPTMMTRNQRSCLWYAVMSKSEKTVKTVLALWPLRDDTDLFCLDYQGNAPVDEGIISAEDLAIQYDNTEMVEAIRHTYSTLEARVNLKKFSTEWPARKQFNNLEIAVKNTEKKEKHEEVQVVTDDSYEVNVTGIEVNVEGVEAQGATQTEESISSSSSSTSQGDTSVEVNAEGSGS